MGLFRKTRKIEPTAAVAPPVIDAGDVAEADRVTAGFLAALGDDAQMRHTAYALSQAGGGPADLEASLMASMRTGNTGIDRPWHWLAGVVEHPAAAGQPRVVAQIAAVVLIWHRELRGRLQLADMSDMMLQAPPVELVTRICSASLRHLRQADGDAVFSHGALTIDGVRALCAEEVQEAGSAADGG